MGIINIVIISHKTQLINKKNIVLKTIFFFSLNCSKLDILEYKTLFIESKTP